MYLSGLKFWCTFTIQPLLTQFKRNIMSYLKRVLIAIDQLGNAIAGGNPDATISGRIGYFASSPDTKVVLYWLVMQFIVDATFYPLDGINHCYDSYLKDKNESYRPAKLVVAFLALSFITVLSCLILIVPFYIFWGLGLIKKRKQNKLS